MIRCHSAGFLTFSRDVGIHSFIFAKNTHREHPYCLLFIKLTFIYIWQVFIHNPGHQTAFLFMAFLVPDWRPSLSAGEVTPGSFFFIQAASRIRCVCRWGHVNWKKKKKRAWSNYKILSVLFCVCVCAHACSCVCTHMFSQDRIRLTQADGWCR